MANWEFRLKFRSALRGFASRRFAALRGVGFEFSFDFVADAAEDVQLFVFGADRVAGIIEGPVEAMDLAGVGRADLIGFATDGDDGVDFLVEEFAHALGAVAADVDADLGHGFDRQRVHVARGFGASAVDIEDVAGGGAQNAFGHVAASRVARAKDQDLRFHLGIAD